MKKLLFLINPVSGAGRGAGLAARIAAEVQGRRPLPDYDIVCTTADATSQVRELASGYETVVAAGGDGTISRVARGLIDHADDIRLGIIPLGTGNDCARSLGLLRVWRSGGLPALLDVILEGTTRPADVFTFGPRHMFINYAGLGRDAAIAAGFDRARRKSLLRALCERGGSKLLYALIALASAGKKCAPGIELHFPGADGTSQTVCFPRPPCQVVIGSIDSYGGGACISSAARMDDARFEVAVMHGSARWLLLHLGRLAGRSYDSLASPGAVFRVPKMRLYTGHSEYAQVDGETVGIEPETWLEIRPAGRVRLIAASP